MPLEPPARTGVLSPALCALEQVAQEQGWTFTPLDPYSRQFVRVAAGDAFFFTGTGRVYAYPLNSSVSASIARDKAFTYEALAAAGIDVPPYGHYFLHPAWAARRGVGREREDAFAYAQSLGYPVFVKPIDGSRGANSDIAFTPDDLDAIMTEIAARHHAVLIQPVLSGEDRRIFILDGEALFTYRRERAALTGDGTRPISALLDDYNVRAVAVGITPVAPDSPFLREALAGRGLALTSVLGAGETLPFAARGNVSAGGLISDFSESVPEDWARWAARIVAILGLRVAAVDFFAPHEGAPVSTLNLIEVNSNPSLSGLIALGRDDLARDIWRRVGTRYFAEQKERGR